MILRLGFSYLILEGHSLTAIEALNSRASNLFSPGLLILEIQSLIQRFQSYEILQVGKQGNEAAC